MEVGECDLTLEMRRKERRSKRRRRKRRMRTQLKPPD
jgi:hypothetical protein